MHPMGGTEIDGFWEMVRAEFNGESAPDLVVRQTTLRFQQGRFCISFAGKISDMGRFEIGQDFRGKTLLLQGEVGPNADRRIACIYQLTGHRLRVCFGLGGVAPSAFVTANGDAQYLATYRRTPETVRLPSGDEHQSH